MAMNRETRRLLQRQGEVDSEGNPLRQRPATSGRPAPGERTGPLEFLREMRAELRKVMWPTRPETVHYSVVVLITIIILTAMIAGLDLLFGEAVLQLFDV